MPTSTELLAIAIFLFTYCFLAFEKLPFLRLDRTGGVLVGAVATVAFGVLGFDEAWQAINSQTIVLLMGMMILNVFLEESGFFELAATHGLRYFKSSIGLLVGLTFLSGILSALFLNDTICLMFTLPLLNVVKAAGLPHQPYLITLAMSANIGSVMTITGNPQNMLIHVYSGYAYVDFLSRQLPVGMTGLVLLVLILLVFYGRQLRGETTESSDFSARDATAVKVDRGLLRLTLLVLTGVLIGFTVTRNLALVSVVGAALLLITSGRPAQRMLARVDWVLLVFFASLFITMAGVAKTGLVTRMADLVEPIYGTSLSTQVPVFSLLTVVASNVVSNVPFVVLARDIMPTLQDPSLMWLILSTASTFAGNLTIPGSVATLIVLQTAGSENRIGFLDFMKIGVPVTFITTAAGVVILFLLGGVNSPP